MLCSIGRQLVQRQTDHLARCRIDGDVIAIDDQPIIATAHEWLQLGVDKLVQ